MEKLKLIENFYDLICPEIIGANTIKKIIALQMFSNLSNGEHINTLLIGGVASGKTQLLLWVNDVIPNSIYCGKKTTPVGMIENLVAADNSIILCDELDKVGREVREQLLESMQSGKITISKYGYHREAKARVNVLAAANPKHYILSDLMPLTSQTNFELPVLSRFHFLIPCHQINSSLYPDIALKYGKHNEDNKKKLTEYIIKVKQEYPIIEISDNIRTRIGHYIRQLKEISSISEIISPRLIEGFISAVKSRARMNLRNHVTDEDFIYVRGILEEIYL
jgi:DNA replicative helicase MCM subunit Mcm2 (Cdc46/Mcm family)